MDQAPDNVAYHDDSNRPVADMERPVAFSGQGGSVCIFHNYTLHAAAHTDVPTVNGTFGSSLVRTRECLGALRLSACGATDRRVLAEDCKTVWWADAAHLACTYSFESPHSLLR